jgi:hypothetical protein
MLGSPSKEIGNELGRSTISSGNELGPCPPLWSFQLADSGLVVILRLLLDDQIL